jgi:hypothetical protein
MERNKQLEGKAALDSWKTARTCEERIESIEALAREWLRRVQARVLKNHDPDNPACDYRVQRRSAAGFLDVMWKGLKVRRPPGWEARLKEWLDSGTPSEAEMVIERSEARMGATL